MCLQTSPSLSRAALAYVAIVAGAQFGARKTCDGDAGFAWIEGELKERRLLRRGVLTFVVLAPVQICALCQAFLVGWRDVS